MERSRIPNQKKIKNIKKEWPIHSDMYVEEQGRKEKQVNYSEKVALVAGIMIIVSIITLALISNY